MRMRVDIPVGSFCYDAESYLVVDRYQLDNEQNRLSFSLDLLIIIQIMIG